MAARIVCATRLALVPHGLEPIACAICDGLPPLNALTIPLMFDCFSVDTVALMPCVQLLYAFTPTLLIGRAPGASSVVLIGLKAALLPQLPPSALNQPTIAPMVVLFTGAPMPCRTDAAALILVTGGA